jgi:predicted ribosome quality control (RQC) complex YloA/Tae2 family protein
VPEVPPPSFDAVTLAAVAREVRAHVGARFAGVRQPGPDAIVLGLRDGRRTSHLFCSIHPRAARVHLASRPEATERLAPFGLLLRSRLAEARLAAVEQPPFDRVLRLRFDALEGALTLSAEVMGRHSNLVLADARVVLGALKVVNEQRSPRRPVLPGRPYLPPPADRPRPDAVDAAALDALLAGERPLEERLSRGLLGVSPLVAREIALRAGLDPGAPAEAARASGERIRAVLQELCAIVRAEAFQPTLYEDRGRVVAFSAIPLRVYAGLRAQAAASMSEAVERYYRGAGEAGPLEERRRALATAVRAALDRRLGAVERDRQALAESRGAERLRVMGDLLLAYGSRVRPGETALVAPDYTAGGAEVAIPLDPALTPAENAQRLFHRYRKARATARALPARIAQVEAEADALREALVQVEAAASPDDLWEVHADLAARGLLRRAPRTRPAATSGPRRFRTPDGAVIVAGRSARENEHVTFRVAGPDDLWFHARGVPGAHVVLKAPGAPTEASITAAAQVAAYYSEGRHAGQVAVDCTPRKRVRRPRGGAPGAVTYEGERTLVVAPALPAATPAPR